MSRILRLEPASQPQNLPAEPEKLERVTYRSTSDLSNGAIFNDLERPLTKISRSHDCLTLHISETARDTEIVTMEY